MKTWTLSAHRPSAPEPLFLAQWFEPDDSVEDTAAVGMRSQVLDHNRCQLQGAGMMDVGSRQATGCGNCRCLKPDHPAGMASV